MSKIALEIPQPALDALQAQLDQHNTATGATLQLTPYLERMVLEVAGMPALRDAIPALEAARDLGYQAAVKAEQARIAQSLGATPL